MSAPPSVDRPLRPAWPPDAVLAVAELEATVDALRQQTAQLQRALESRVVIEQAKGILAERFDIGPEAAFALLRGAARSAQIRLHDLAAQVVAAPSTPAPVAHERARRPRKEV